MCFTSGKLKSDAKLATDMYVALKRREQDAFADVMMKRNAKMEEI